VRRRAVVGTTATRRRSGSGQPGSVQPDPSRHPCCRIPLSPLPPAFAVLLDPLLSIPAPPPPPPLSFLDPESAAPLVRLDRFFWFVCAGIHQQSLSPPPPPPPPPYFAQLLTPTVCAFRAVLPVSLPGGPVVWSVGRRLLCSCVAAYISTHCFVFDHVCCPSIVVLSRLPGASLLPPAVPNRCAPSAPSARAALRYRHPKPRAPLLPERFPFQPSVSTSS